MGSRSTSRVSFRMTANRRLCMAGLGAANEIDERFVHRQRHVVDSDSADIGLMEQRRQRNVIGVRPRGANSNLIAVQRRVWALARDRCIGLDRLVRSDREELTRLLLGLALQLARRSLRD